jgi:hypothetical protein
MWKAKSYKMTFCSIISAMLATIAYSSDSARLKGIHWQSLIVPHYKATKSQ